MRAAILLSFVVACGADDTIGARAQPPSTPAPTFYRDVEPVVQARCATCHQQLGAAAFDLDRQMTTTIAGRVSDKVANREMPAWLPGPVGARVVGDRRLSNDEIRVFVDWVNAGAPSGDPRDHRDVAPPVRFAIPRGPDARVTMPTEYVRPVEPARLEETRCFVVDLPPQAASRWVTAARFAPGYAPGIHRIGAAVVDAEGAKLARARPSDGRPGWSCPPGLTDLPNAHLLGTTSTAFDDGIVMPAGTGVKLPAGGAIVLAIHYTLGHLDVADRSGVDLWLESGEGLRELATATAIAPVEIPCPHASTDDRCSRDAAIARAGGEAIRTASDERLRRCGKVLPTPSPVPDGKPFVVATDCVGDSFRGKVVAVTTHLRTFGASSRVDVERPDGTWTTVLDVPRWRLSWEGSYVLVEGVDARRMRVSCTFDNGTANQWSAATHEPGHNGPAKPPLEAPSYVIASPERASEACTASVLYVPTD